MTIGGIYKQQKQQQKQAPHAGPVTSMAPKSFKLTQTGKRKIKVKVICPWCDGQNPDCPRGRWWFVDQDID